MGIFRSYDVRGIYRKDIDEEIMRRIGESFAAHVKKDVVVARDCRMSSPTLMSAFIDGAASHGIAVHDAGMLPLGAGMFHAWREGLECAYITASHLPKEWCGVKFFHSNGIGIMEDEILEIKRIFSGNAPEKVRGSVKSVREDISGNYIRYLTKKTHQKKKLRILVDNGNGVSSLVVKNLFTSGGHHVDVIFEEPDGRFPNRLPDPADTEIGKLKEMVSGYDIGIAYDGDADRMAVVDEKGAMLSPEQTSYLIMSCLLKTEKGPIIANVECTRLIDDIAKKFSRHVIRSPVGHTFLMQYVNDNKACYGVESAGHYCIPSIVPFDDAIAASLYAVSALSHLDCSLSSFVKEMPVHSFERKSFVCPDDMKSDVMKKLKETIMEQYGSVTTIDGVRVDFDNGWALLRMSNTSPYIRLTVEGDTKKDFYKIQKTFIGLLEDEMTSRGMEMKEEHGK